MRTRTKVGRRGAALLAVLGALGVLAAAGCTAQGTKPSVTPKSATAEVSNPNSGSAAVSRPNIVFVLTDDLSMNLLAYMPHVQALQQAGTTFSNYTVTDSLCCPSRSSIFTGRFPHNTKIFTNHGKDGGFRLFHSRREEKSTFATSLQKAGYRTAMMGKYMNEYYPKKKMGTTRPYVPPGWSEWDVAGSAYSEYNYSLNQNHTVRDYGNAPGDYLTDVVSAKASAFITRSAGEKKPFLLEVATFAPHAPYTPALRDMANFRTVTAPRTPAFNRLPSKAPAWLKHSKPLTGQQSTYIDNSFRRRVQAVQSVDRMVASLQNTLITAGVADRTVVVFSSDNGYHMGEYRLTPGKMTAFDTDIRVPLIAAGPGVVAGQVVADPAENIDLRPTFEDLAGARTPSEVDGRSLRNLLAGRPVAAWRTAALVEHHGPDTFTEDPDFPARSSGNPPNYAALRTVHYTYVEYAKGGKEYYDRRTDPDELHNTVGTLSRARIAQLHKALVAMTKCRGQKACGTAARRAH